MKEKLRNEDLEKVSGGKRPSAPDPYAGYPGDLRNNISPGVLSIVQSTAMEYKANGLDRDYCGRYLQEKRYNELCHLNESQGYDFHIDFMYLNWILDTVYGYM